MCQWQLRGSKKINKRADLFNYCDRETFSPGACILPGVYMLYRKLFFSETAWILPNLRAQIQRSTFQEADREGTPFSVIYSAYGLPSKETLNLWTKVELVSSLIDLRGLLHMAWRKKYLKFNLSLTIRSSKLLLCYFPVLLTSSEKSP